MPRTVKDKIPDEKTERDFSKPESTQGITGFGGAMTEPVEEPVSKAAMKPVNTPDNTEKAAPEVATTSKPIRINLNAGKNVLAANAKTNADTFSMETNNNFYKKALFPILLVLFLAVAGFFVYELKLKNVIFVNPLNLSDIPGFDGSFTGGITDGFENPINGMMFRNEDAAKFKDRKPIAVMVNNYVVARPSAGLSQADIVYEAVAESGITRLMPIFYSRIPEKVSSIRSARYYFVELASAYKAHYIHWGAAHVPPCQKNGTCAAETLPETDAYDRIVQLGVANLDGGNYSCDRDDCAFGRDPDKLNKVPLEHTAFVRLPLIYDLAKQVRTADSWHNFIPFEPAWKFKNEAGLDQRGTVGQDTPITYNYWDTMAGFNVKWEYDREKNEYVRWQGDVKQTDALNGQELRAKVIIIRFTEQRPAGDKKNHLIHDIVGTGEALVFQDGNVIKGKWSRTTHEAMDQYTDESGNPIEFVRGQIWVQLVPTGNAVTYQSSTAPAPDAAQ